MQAKGDVIIAGGGVIGLTTAYFLAKDGARVVLCEQGQTGMESSWAGAGILPPSDLEHAQYPLDRLRALSGSIFPELSSDLQARTGIDNGFARSGGLEFLSYSGHTPSDEWYGLGVVTKHLTERDTLAVEPALAPNLGDALFLPGMAQLRNPWHMQALRAACLDTGHVAIHEELPVQGLIVESGRVKGVRAGGEVLTGAAVLLAAGAWTDRLLEPLGCQLRIQPVRGQIALLNPGTVLFRRILLCGSRYLVPRLDGRVLVGSTEEHVGYDKSTTAMGIAGLITLAVSIVPDLATAAVEKTWSGLRPGSPDGLPFIGPVPGMENLYVAAGHFRAGIQLSPGTALLLKESLLGQPLTMPIDAFRLDR